MIHYQDEYVEFGHWDDISACFLIYKRFGTSDEFRSANKKLLAFFEEKKLGKLMIDARYIGALGEEDQIWISQEVTPRLIAASPNNKYFSAMVTGEDVFAQIGIESIEEVIDQGDNYTVGMFITPEEAKQWLAEQGE